MDGDHLIVRAIMVSEHTVDKWQVGHCQVSNPSSVLPPLINGLPSGKLAAGFQTLELFGSGAYSNPTDGAPLVCGDLTLSGEESSKDTSVLWYLALPSESVERVRLSQIASKIPRILASP